MYAMSRVLPVLFVLAAVALRTPAQLLWGEDFDNHGFTGSPYGPYIPGPVGTFGQSHGNNCQSPRTQRC